MKQKQIICSKIEYRQLGSSGDWSSIEIENGNLTPQFNESRAGKYQTQKLVFNADIETSVAKDIQTSPKEWKITALDGTVITWGDVLYRARVEQFNREGTATSAVLVRKSPYFEL